MFRVIEEIRRRASVNSKKIVFPESDDRRILQAAEAISRHRIASPITLGELARIKDRARQAGVQALHVEVRQPEPRKIDAYAKMLAAEWTAQGIREVEARRKLKDPTQYAAAMVRFGDADGLIAGPPGKEREAVSVRAMGLSPKGSMVSRCFLVALPDGDRPEADGLLFADSGALVTPTSSELAAIAIDAGRQTRHLLGCEPHVAFLAFGVIASSLRGEEQISERRPCPQRTRTASHRSSRSAAGQPGDRPSNAYGCSVSPSNSRIRSKRLRDSQHLRLPRHAGWGPWTSTPRAFPWGPSRRTNSARTKLASE